MSLGCARCGSCCERIYLSIEHEDIALRTHTEDGRFIREHWHKDGDSYRCDQLLDGLCTAYETRPPVCRNYPWYGEEPGRRSRLVNPACSYLLDVPPDQRPEGSRPLIPLEVLGA